MPTKLARCWNCKEAFEQDAPDANWCPKCIKIEIDKMESLIAWDEVQEKLTPWHNSAGTIKQAHFLGYKAYLCSCGRLERDWVVKDGCIERSGCDIHGEFEPGVGPEVTPQAPDLEEICTMCLEARVNSASRLGLCTACTAKFMAQGNSKEC